jgi:RNA polymerase sigma-70 factor (ECF subfamily)
MPVTLAQIYDAEAAAVFGFALNLTRDRDAAREILQEIFVRVARLLHAERKADWSRSLLLAMTHRLVIDRYRRAETRLRAIERFSAEPSHPFAASGDPDEESFRAALAEAMAELPDEQRAVAHLRLWEGLTFAEIGEVLAISANTAASRYRYALDKLQGSLRSLYEEIR